MLKVDELLSTEGRGEDLCNEATGEVILPPSGILLEVEVKCCSGIGVASTQVVVDLLYLTVDAVIVPSRKKALFPAVVFHHDPLPPLLLTGDPRRHSTVIPSEGIWLFPRKHNAKRMWSVA